MFFLCLFFCPIFLYIDYVNKRNRLGHFEGFQVDICRGINTNKILLLLLYSFRFLFTDKHSKSRCLGFWMYILHRPPPCPILSVAKYRYEFSVSHSTAERLRCWFFMYSLNPPWNLRTLSLEIVELFSLCYRQLLSVRKYLREKEVVKASKSDPTFEPWVASLLGVKLPLVRYNCFSKEFRHSMSFKIPDQESFFY